MGDQGLGTGAAAGLAVRSCAGFAPEIDRIADSGPGSRGFLRAAWFAGTGGDGRTLVAVRADGTPAIAVPTVGMGRGRVGMRAVPGSYWPFRSIAVAPDATVAEAAAMLAHPAARTALGLQWRLGPVLADDPAVRLLRRGAAQAGWTTIARPLGSSFRLDLADGWPRAATRRRLAAYERRLRGRGTLRLDTVSGQHWSAATLDALAGVEAASWVARDTDGRGAKFLSPAARTRWARVLADPRLSRALSATLLFLDERPIAFSFDLAAGDTQYALASSYDEAHADVRPGRIVTAHQFDAARAAGIRHVDLGTGDSGYKREMGAVAGPEVIDLLLLRNRAAAQLIGWRWGTVPRLAGDIVLAPPRPRSDHGVVAGLAAAGALAALALAMAE